MVCLLAMMLNGCNQGRYNSVSFVTCEELFPINDTTPALK